MQPRPGRARLARAMAATAAAALLAGCGPAATEPSPAATATRPPAGPTASGPAPSAASVDPGTLDQPAVHATGLRAPWSIAFVDATTALVSERDSATVVEVSADGSLEPLAQVAGTMAGGEGGLLGLAVHDGYLYACTTTADDNRVLRAPLSGEPGALRLGQPEVVLEGLPRAANHNGGRIAFGPDGMLYVTAGDASRPDAAQDPSSLAGKILRVEPDGAIPADNPFPGSPVYSLGHRNPQGLAWDDEGAMYATEFGQSTWDELNRIEAGANYGWPVVEGAAGDARFVDPLQQWHPSEASPSGMAYADGSLWIANLRGQSLRQVDLADPSRSTVHWLAEHGRMRDVVLAPDGALWALTGNTDGRGAPAEGDDRILVFVP
ncbi:PQQ-dependent sugar dehydrogenase [Agrococcus sp. SCSIO52902]|uniref:PQQ-dependent sugar dehydrogenase n=1 Tax=Agrococcus sp. SCSIO52902 TaxID=2933290 RepID=UPI001FF28241|nr:PQQ-dependent sugar dehydrogenase [Agrococcus sp. SCSIO52902]UOW00178.1 PQQ-dependent sugar dehydrogenase [Agrococcus sp. SCSIO52902]